MPQTRRVIRSKKPKSECKQKTEEGRDWDAKNVGPREEPDDRRWFKVCFPCNYVSGHYNERKGKNVEIKPYCRSAGTQRDAYYNKFKNKTDPRITGMRVMAQRSNKIMRRYMDEDDLEKMIEDMDIYLKAVKKDPKFKQFKNFKGFQALKIDVIDKNNIRKPPLQKYALFEKLKGVITRQWNSLIRHMKEEIKKEKSLFQLYEEFMNDEVRNYTDKKLKHDVNIFKEYLQEQFLKKKTKLDGRNDLSDADRKEATKNLNLHKLEALKEFVRAWKNERPNKTTRPKDMVIEAESNDDENQDLNYEDKKKREYVNLRGRVPINLRKSTIKAVNASKEKEKTRETREIGRETEEDFDNDSFTVRLRKGFSENVEADRNSEEVRKSQEAAKRKAQEEAKRIAQKKAQEEAKRKAQEETKRIAQKKAQEEAKRIAQEKAQEKEREDREAQEKEREDREAQEKEREDREAQKAQEEARRIAQKKAQEKEREDREAQEKERENREAQKSQKALLRKDTKKNQPYVKGVRTSKRLANL